MQFCREMDWSPFRLERWQIRQIKGEDGWKNPAPETPK